jgi:hypothetical protein
MKVCPHAEFRVDLPDDAVFDGDRLVVSPGQGLAEIISDMLARLGYSVSPPEDVAEHGWQFDAYANGRRVWLQVSQIFLGEGILMTKELPAIFQRVFRRKESIHAALLSGLHREMLADPRFQDLKWWPDFHFRGVPAKVPLRTD